MELRMKTDHDQLTS